MINTESHQRYLTITKKPLPLQWGSPANTILDEVTATHTPGTMGQ